MLEGWAVSDAEMPFRPDSIIDPLAEMQENRDYWMERAVAAEQMLADAPHSYYCGTVIGNTCRCWKAGL